MHTFNENRQAIKFTQAGIGPLTVIWEMIVLEIKIYLMKLRINNFLENPRKRKNVYVTLTIRNAGDADIRTHIHTYRYIYIYIYTCIRVCVCVCVCVCVYSVIPRGVQNLVF